MSICEDDACIVVVVVVVSWPLHMRKWTHHSKLIVVYLNRAKALIPRTWCAIVCDSLEQNAKSKVTVPPDCQIYKYICVYNTQNERRISHRIIKYHHQKSNYLILKLIIRNWIRCFFQSSICNLSLTFPTQKREENKTQKKTRIITYKFNIPRNEKTTK